MEAKKPRRQGKDKKVVRVNGTLCRYEVVKKIVRDRGWQMVTDEEDKAAIASCNLHWIDVPDFHNTFKILQPYAKVNHFPGMTNLARKSKLARNFERMKKFFPDEYDFCPKTWILPFDLHDFQQQFNSEGMSSKTFIVKPDHNCQGRGVFLTRNLNQINKQDVMVAQQYVKNPLLIEGKKFDLRIYVFIASCNPLRVYLFKDGLVRMCTADYVAPNADNMEQRFMHLTNYAVNKHANNFEVNKTPSQDGSGSKRSLRWFFAWLKQSFSDDRVDTLWTKIGDICLKAILAVQPTLAQEYRSTFAKNLRKVSSASAAGPQESSGVSMGRLASAPESAGMDVLVDEALKPWLLEVNHLPSFGCDSPLDWNIKERLINQTLDIMRISVDDKKRYEAEHTKSMQKRLYGGSSVVDNNSGDADSEAGSEGQPEDTLESSKSDEYTVLSPENLRSSLTLYYQRFNAERVKNLDKILIKYQDRQEELNRSLAHKYGKSIHDFAPIKRRPRPPQQQAVAEMEDDQEELIDYILMYPPPRHEFIDSKYRKMLEASLNHTNEQQMRFSAPLQHRRATMNGEALSSTQGGGILPMIKGASKKGAADLLGRDCFGFTGTDKAKWLAAMERNKKPLVTPGPEQLASAHRLMLGHSSQKLSIKPPTPPEHVPNARRESINYGLQYRERLATLKAKPTIVMTQISFGSF